MPAIVNSAAVAEALNLTERRVEQLVHEGMPRVGRGKYDVWTCAKWYVRYLQKAMERRATENGEDRGNTNLTEEKKRLLRIQADIAQVDYQKKIGDLIPAHLVDDRFATFASTVRDRFIALPSRVAKRLEGESGDVIRVKLYEAVRDVLNGLSVDLTGSDDAGGGAKKRGAKQRRSDGPDGARSKKTGKVSQARRRTARNLR